MVVERKYIKKSTGLQHLHFRVHFSQTGQDSYGPEVEFQLYSRACRRGLWSTPCRLEGLFILPLLETDPAYSA